MTVPKINTIVVVGGGTAGWMSAALLAKSLGTANYSITLVESEEIGTVGVGEATIPAIQKFNNFLGLDENEFMRQTQATIKLGIQFVDWKSVGSSYFHPFGSFGIDMDNISFHDFWLRLVSHGGNPDFGLYNLETLAALENRFGRATARGDASNQPVLNYAFQFDAGLYAIFLRRYCEKRGVVRKEGKIIRVKQDAETGFVTHVVCEDGSTVTGDIFLDCSGFRGLLIEQTLKSGYEDWTHWLPCNRAAAVPCESASLPSGQPAPITPYTRATAREAGWQWRIPLQHRIGNGYVYSSEYISDDEACTKLLSRLDGNPLKDPKILRFTTGHRKQVWNKNVVAIGLASGFLEPLESTSIYLVQLGVMRLLRMMPKQGFSPVITADYNRLMLGDYNDIKDFLIAHYKITDREDTPFWKMCKYMDIPDDLKNRLEIFREQGHARTTSAELFRETSWFAMLFGQGMHPRDYSPSVDAITNDDLRQRMMQVRTDIMNRLRSLSTHDEFIARNCSAIAMEKS